MSNKFKKFQGQVVLMGFGEMNWPIFKVPVFASKKHLNRLFLQGKINRIKQNQCPKHKKVLLSLPENLSASIAGQDF